MMRRSWVGMLLALCAAAAGAAERCRPIPGLEPWERPGAVLLLGEIHGTVEGPAFVGDVACHVARAELPVVVALELPVERAIFSQLALNDPGSAIQPCSPCPLGTRGRPS